MAESKLQLNTNAADVSENDLREKYSDALDVLLRDHTTGKNIFWATDNYTSLGKGFEYHSEIVPSLITGEYGRVIRPRVQNDNFSKDLNAQLYALVDLTFDEINFIETAIKPME